MVTKKIYCAGNSCIFQLSLGKDNLFPRIFQTKNHRWLDVVLYKCIVSSDQIDIYLCKTLRYKSKKYILTKSTFLIFDICKFQPTLICKNGVTLKRFFCGFNVDLYLKDKMILLMTFYTQLFWCKLDILFLIL